MGPKYTARARPRTDMPSTREQNEYMHAPCRWNRHHADASFIFYVRAVNHERARPQKATAARIVSAAQAHPGRRRARHGLRGATEKFGNTFSTRAHLNPYQMTRATGATTTTTTTSGTKRGRTAARELQGSGGFQEIIECFRRVNEAHESFVVEGCCAAGSGDVDTLLASRGAFVVYLHACGDETSKASPSDDAVISKRRVAGSVAIA